MLGAGVVGLGQSYGVQDACGGGRTGRTENRGA